MNICVTGSLGLIGQTCALHFLNQGHQVVGIDNNGREEFFGKNGQTKKYLNLFATLSNYSHHNIDISSYEHVLNLFSKQALDAVIHCAAQPSHDKAREIPLRDFQVNALGTLNMLEATRLHSPNATFVFTSTNKVYGDNPNKMAIKEYKTRYDYADPKSLGVDETMSLDHCTHSLFGVSKCAADLYVQEYAHSFGLTTTTLRLGCITGSHHASVQLHGFLSYLVRSLINNNRYEIIGYKGKQVRDQLHAADVAGAIEAVIQKPKSGEVYNLGGGRSNSASILELITTISNKLHSSPIITISKKVRLGDHICYISNTSKFQKAYPAWKMKYSLDKILDEIIAYELQNI